MIESRMAGVPALVERMRREDREFITAETVSMFSDCSMPEAAVALTRLGFTPEQIGPLGDGHGLPVVRGERVFAVIRGRRWTKVPEYLSNGQLTARWFLDEATGEAREAEGWKAPRAWRLPESDAAFVRRLVAER